MSTQQSAQERAEQRAKAYAEPRSRTYVDMRNIMRDFLAGETSGYQIAIDELNAKITTLEAQNKKLGDVVLEMTTIIGAFRPTSWSLDRHVELVKQLKQERGNE
jgi:hypothetical protein